MHLGSSCRQRIEPFIGEPAKLLKFADGQIEFCNKSLPLLEVRMGIEIFDSRTFLNFIRGR